MLEFLLRRYCLFLLLLCSLVLSLLLHSGGIGLPIAPVLAQSSSPQLVQQGIAQYQAGDFSGAIAIWQQALQQTELVGDQVVIWSNLAQAYQQIGQLDQAIAQWQQLIQFYQSGSDADSQEKLAEILVEQAQAYGLLGQHRRAIPLLESALEVTTEQITVAPSAIATQVAVQGALGDAYTALGDYDRALTAYQTGLDQVSLIDRPTLQMSQLQITLLNNLGNLHLKQAERDRFLADAAERRGEQLIAQQLKEEVDRETKAAQDSYQQSWQLSQATGGIPEATALLNLNRLLEQATEPDRSQIGSNRQRIEVVLQTVPDSRGQVFALIALAESLNRLPLTPQDQGRSQDLLRQALDSAEAIGDQRAASFALGTLGKFEETAGNYGQALQWTEQAGMAAQQVDAAESLYQWQWQRGRILKAIGEPEQAIQAYQQAITTLQSIRGDIISASSELQFTFRDAVEPVYRELMELLLEFPTATSPVSLEPETNALQQVLSTLELLKLAELQNFFGDECVQLVRDQVEQEGRLTDTSAAVLYSVLLKQRTEMILKTPDGRLSHYPVLRSDGTLMVSEELETEIDQLRRLLEKRTTDDYLPQAQRVYDLLIRPLEADLAKAQPQTLVLVNDGVLRNVPLAALQDGRQFLVEKYAIATTPSLSLTTSTPMDRHNLEALILGLTVARESFPALSNVASEADSVQEIVGGVKLLNQDFTLEQFQSQLRKHYYPIIHIATHGQFGVDGATTFLQAYDKRLRIEEIDTLLFPGSQNNPVELLTLSSCETATGDNRTALGIAGVAVRAGAKSALATLWYINDAATVPLIEQFYESLRQPQLSKAAALQQAQVSMIHNPHHPEYSHPGVWAPFILVGNWL